MNAQTPGPLTVEGPHLWAGDSPCKPRYAVALVAGPNSTERRDEKHANRALLAASYTLLDRTARELGVDAVELAKGLDLAGLIRGAHALLMLDDRHPNLAANTREQVERLGAALMPLAGKLPAPR